VRVDRLTCTQFRNLEPLDLSFAPGVNLFVGKNGQGKTNILEAIQFFKFGRSFRAGRDTELIRFGEAFCRAEVASTLDAGERETFAAAIERGGAKTIKIDGKEIARLSELVGRFPCVLFGPDDLRLVSGAPADRRRFIDMTGSMTTTGYIETARDYRRILQQRNAALKARVKERELATWNEQLIAAGAALVERRRVLVDDIGREVAAHAAELRTRSGSFELSYESSLLAGVGSAGDGTPTVSDVFSAKLAALADEERRRATTLAGPHRDDVILRLDGTDLRAYGSQGQKRLFAVLLKLAELSYLEGQLGETCVLLLDDVFSEFDRDITKKLQLLLDGKRQVFVTSPVDLVWARAENARVYGVRSGRVSSGEIGLE